MVESNRFGKKEKRSCLGKRVWKIVYKSPNCQWCQSSEIKLVPVSSLANLKPGEKPRYEKLWKKQGWPTNRYLCWICRLNCELAYGKVNVWLCPGCRKVFVYLKEPTNSNTIAYQQLPANCSCNWKKKHLSKKEQQKIADQTIKSGLVYKKDQKTSQKGYLAQCSFCQGAIEAQKRKKEVKNRNKLRFWTDKLSEERLVCNKCLRGNGEFQKLLLEKNLSRWRVYKSKGVI